jgi:hypothetical protein
MKARNYILALIVAVVTLVTPLASFAQNAPPTPNAWGKARWGMSLEELIEAYPDLQASIDEFRIRVTCEYLKKFQVNKTTYSYLSFTFIHHRLFAVATGVDRSYGDVVSDLIRKYGPPVTKDKPIIGGDPRTITTFVDKSSGTRIVKGPEPGTDCGKYTGVTYSDINNHDIY